MSGSDDYLLIVLVRDIEDFERIHRTELSRLPHVSRIQSNFALREVVNRTAPLGIFEKPARHVQSQLPQRHSPNMGRDADPNSMHNVASYSPVRCARNNIFDWDSPK